MDLVLGLFKLSKMEEDMDKIVSCVQVIFHNNLENDDFDADTDTQGPSPEPNRLFFF